MASLLLRRRELRLDFTRLLLLAGCLQPHVPICCAPF
jgi:hypothetical protein